MEVYTEFEDLQNDCKLKTQNLKTALESAQINEFNSLWILENYLSCLKESELSVKKLLESMHSDHS